MERMGNARWAAVHIVRDKAPKKSGFCDEISGNEAGFSDKAPNNSGFCDEICLKVMRKNVHKQRFTSFSTLARVGNTQQ